MSTPAQLIEKASQPSDLGEKQGRATAHVLGAQVWLSVFATDEPAEITYTLRGMRSGLSAAVVVAFAACSSPGASAIEEGNTAARDGRLEDARAAYERATKDVAVAPRAHALLGNAIWAMGLRDGGLEWVRGGDDEFAKVSLAEVALLEHDAEAALALVERSSRPRARIIRARAHLALGRAAQALQALDGLADDDSLYVRGNAQLALNQYGEAQTTFENLKRANAALGSYGLARLAAAQHDAAATTQQLRAVRAQVAPRDRPRFEDAISRDPAFEFVKGAAAGAAER